MVLNLRRHLRRPRGASRSRSLRAVSGMAMVEFVIVLPVLLMILFAIVEFGVVFGRWQTLSNAAREGARLAVVFRAPCDGPTVEAEVRQTVKDYASNLGIVLNDTDITVTGECDATVGSQTTVQVNFDHPFRVLPGFAEGLNPTLALVGTSVMRNEGSG